MNDPMGEPINDQAPVCDYENSGYQADFWQGKGRDYEDAVERIALRRLLPETGKRCAEFGAGFGRLTDELAGYDQVVLVDYSRTMLQQAQARLGRSDRYMYVAADLHHLPFAADAFDGATLIRVIHHIPDPLSVLQQIHGTLTSSAAFILEYANKQNLKAIARYLSGRQTWSPFDQAAVEFVKLNYDFHPAAMRGWLREAGFIPGQTLAVSSLRMNALKRRLPLALLKTLDRAIQPSGAVLPLSPSVFVRNSMSTADTISTPVPLAAADALFVNPTLKTSVLRREADMMICPATGTRWAIHDGIYDFKETL